MHSITQFLSDILNTNPGELSIGHAILAFFVAYLGGVLSSLTPCVYPMIPITVGVVGGIGSKRKSWHEVTFKSAAYVSGMALIYSFLGVLAGISGKVFGSFTNHSGGYLIVGTIMTLAALVMLDILSFDPLAWWTTLKTKFLNTYHPSSPQPSQEHTQKHHHKHPHKHPEMTFVGAFFLGASSGFIAAPCTTPVLSSILAFIAKTQSVGLGFVLMLAFSLGLGTLILTLALFAGSIQVLPRSGQWMKTVKTGSGLILLAFAEYLIYRAGTLGGL